jgi:hypothetical protein
MDGTLLQTRDVGVEKNSISLRVQRVWLRDDGIVQTEGRSGTVQTRADAEACMVAIWTLSGGKRRPLLVDMRSMAVIERDARAYYAGTEPERFICAGALIVGSPLTRAIANFIVGIKKKPVTPTRMFTSEREAVAWLRGFLE